MSFYVLYLFISIEWVPPSELKSEPPPPLADICHLPFHIHWVGTPLRTGEWTQTGWPRYPCRPLCSPCSRGPPWCLETGCFRKPYRKYSLWYFFVWLAQSKWIVKKLFYESVLWIYLFSQNALSPLTVLNLTLRWPYYVYSYKGGTHTYIRNYK